VGEKVCSSLFFLSGSNCTIRISFNITFLIIGLFSTVAGASDSSMTLIFLASVWSIGVGGNVPVDSAVFLGEPSQIQSQTLW